MLSDLMFSLFRYSGNKGRLLQHLPALTADVVHEPFLGSGAYGLNSGASVVYGSDANGDVITLWKFLQETTPERLHELAALVEQNKKAKTDIRTLGLPDGEMLYLKVNCCSVMVGQLSSWKLYPQHSLPVEKTILALPLAKKFQVSRSLYQSFDTTRIKPKDVVFIDPPYMGTRANYKASGASFDGLHPQILINWIARLPPCRILFTYGSDAKNVFPDFKWHLACTRKVPNLREGGTVERQEMFTDCKA